MDEKTGIRMTPRALLLSTARELAARGVPDPETDAALLLAYLLSREPLSLRVDMETELSADTLSAFRVLAERRASREPLQYILGSVPFCGLTFQVDPRVLIPRPETALLAEWALEELQDVSSPAVLDLCCGSGCLGLTVKRRRPDARVTLADLSPDALQVARMNASTLETDVEFLQGDLFSPLLTRYDLILSNPPYIPSGQCSSLQEEVLREPPMALDGGSDGLDFYRRIVREAPAYLFPGGRLMLELGDGEAEPVRELLPAAGFTSAVVRKDLAGLDRMLLAK